MTIPDCAAEGSTSSVVASSNTMARVKLAGSALPGRFDKKLE
jgi:hypothetical protein